jgi:hypothetical protein
VLLRTFRNLLQLDNQTQFSTDNVIIAAATSTSVLPVLLPDWPSLTLRYVCRCNSRMQEFGAACRTTLRNGQRLDKGANKVDNFNSTIRLFNMTAEEAHSLLGTLGVPSWPCLPPICFLTMHLHSF